MEFISTKDAAARWGISQRRVIRLASEGRLPGAKLFGNSRMIPADAEKPIDGRTKAAKTTPEPVAFYRRTVSGETLIAEPAENHQESQKEDLRAFCCSKVIAHSEGWFYRSKSL